MVWYILIINSDTRAFACYELLVHWRSQKGESTSTLYNGHGNKLAEAMQVTNLQNIIISLQYLIYFHVPGEQTHSVQKIALVTPSKKSFFCLVTQQAEEFSPWSTVINTTLCSEPDLQW